jgi:hypothetical protein
MNPIDLAKENLEILQWIDLWYEWRQCTKGISNPSMGQRDWGLGEDTLRWEKPVGGTETPILGELISSKNSKISHRNQEIVKWGLSVTLTVVLVCVCEREERKQWRGKVCPGGLNPQKSDSPVSETG